MCWRSLSSQIFVAILESFEEGGASGQLTTSMSGPLTTSTGVSVCVHEI